MSLENGKLVIVAGPSGSGKTTIVRHLLSVFPRLAFSISACSRAKRVGERDGEDYYFLTAVKFKEKVNNGEFLEWEEVYPGSYYGTLKSEVKRLWMADRDVIFDIDVKGALNLKKHFKERAVTIFIQPPSVEALEQRLKERNTETPGLLAERVGKAKLELSFAPQFDEQIPNKDLPTAFADAEKIVADYLGVS
jgi:guanylate kinase